jgi:hypothetical protein
MRDACSAALRLIFTTRGRMYEPNAQLESGEEHFELSVAELVMRVPPSARQTTRRGSDRPKKDFGNVAAGAGEAAQGSSSADTDDPALLAILRSPGSLNVINRTGFLRFIPLFYAIAWQQSEGNWVSFIRKANPRLLFKTGRRWCQYSDALKRVPTEPTFVLDQQIDVIVDAEKIVSFSGSALKNLFADLQLVQTEVPAYVRAASETIREHIPLSDQSIESLNAAGKRLQSVATRLYGLSTRLNELKEHGSLTGERYREIAGEDENALGLLGSDGQFDFDENGALIFLDIIEGRYFEDDWTGSARRADRFSQRGE